ncbi:hypothetical protein V8C34DRAFT_286737 [Trichoderma compactum]
MIPASLRDIHQDGNALMTKKESRVTYKLKTNCMPFTIGGMEMVVGTAAVWTQAGRRHTGYLVLVHAKKASWRRS